jgi:hypothetical protein
MNFGLYVYLYATKFLFIAWAYNQSIDFIMNGGVKMEICLVVVMVLVRGDNV